MLPRCPKCWRRFTLVKCGVCDEVMCTRCFDKHRKVHGKPPEGVGLAYTKKGKVEPRF